MARGKNAPEMFEAFYRMGQSVPAAESAKKPAEPRREPNAGVSPTRPASPGGILSPLDTPQAHVFPLGRRTDVVFALSYNAAVVALVVVLFTAFLVGFVGYRLGQRAVPVSEQPKDTGPQKRGLSVYEGKGDPTGVSKQGASKDGRSTATVNRPHLRVQIVTRRSTIVAKRVLNDARDFLASKGIPDLVVIESSDKKWVALFAGVFNKDEEKAAAEQLARKIQQIRYEGKKQFESAFVKPFP